MKRRWFETFARRTLQRGVLAHWIKRLRIAEGILWLASIEADALFKAWELVKCIVCHSSRSS